MNWIVAQDNEVFKNEDLQGPSGLKLWAFLFVLLVLIYLPSMNSPFTLDDAHSIQNNAYLHHLSNWAKVWTSSRTYSSLPANWGYRPATTFSHLIAWNIADGATWPFHLMKIIIFSTLCALLYKCWCRLLPNTSPQIILAALVLFAINPVHSQVICYLSAMSTLLAGFFVTLSLYTFLRYKDSTKFKWIACCTVSLFFAAMAKEEGIVGVGLIPLVDLYLRKISGQKLFDKNWFKLIFIMAIPAVLSLGLIYYMYEDATKLARGQMSVWVYFMTQWRAYIRYFVMYFYSYDLNVDNLEFGFDSNIKNFKVLTYLFLNLIVIVGAVWSWRHHTWFTLMVAWFYFGILPASGFIPLSEPVNDHRAFIGYLIYGFMSIALLGVVYKKNIKIFYALTALLFIFYCGFTFQRARIWQSAETIWEDTIKKNPTSARARNNLAIIKLRKAEYLEALKLLDDCMKFGPQYYVCYTNRGEVESALGHDAEAEKYYVKALDYEVSQFFAKTFYAQFLSSRGFLTKPLNILLEVDAMTKGANIDVRSKIISLYVGLGQREAAQKSWREALVINGSDPQLLSLGRSLGFN